MLTHTYTGTHRCTHTQMHTHTHRQTLTHKHTQTLTHIHKLLCFVRFAGAMATSIHRAIRDAYAPHHPLLAAPWHRRALCANINFTKPEGLSSGAGSLRAQSMADTL